MQFEFAMIQESSNNYTTEAPWKQLFYRMRKKRTGVNSFMQRIPSLEKIGEMNAEKIRQYISHRIKMAGGKPSIFTQAV